MAFTAFNAPPTKSRPTIVKSEPVATPLPPKRIQELESAFEDRQDLLKQLQPLAAARK
jgi:hypothetical protein